MATLASVANQLATDSLFLASQGRRRPLIGFSSPLSILS